MKNLFRQPQQPSPIKQAISAERLRQARYAFNSTLIFSSLFATIGVIGAVMLMTGSLPEGAVMATTGTAAATECMRLAKDVNDRLDDLLDD
jgi:hypothetical protein